MQPKHNLRVVVADDEELMLFILMKNMNDNGYQAKGFGGGLPLWEYLQSHPNQVDIVILDKLMDDLCGIEIIKRMKNHPVLKNIPVMLQSGDINKQEGLDAGADHYLMKPYSNKEIIKIVGQLTSLRPNSHSTFH